MYKKELPCLILILLLGLTILGCVKPYKLYDDTKVHKHDVVLIKPGLIITLQAGYFGPGAPVEIIKIDGTYLMKDGNSLCTVNGCEVSPGKHVITVNYTWDSPDHSLSEIGIEIGSILLALLPYSSGESLMYIDIPDSSCSSTIHFDALPYREYHVNVVQRDRADKPEAVTIVNFSSGEIVASEACL